LNSIKILSDQRNTTPPHLPQVRDRSSQNLLSQR
jgi:hypothetical protein